MMVFTAKVAFFSMTSFDIRCENPFTKDNLHELQVHSCNKLANRHVRVGLADPSDVPHCDICENAPGMEVHLFITFSL